MELIKPFFIVLAILSLTTGFSQDNSVSYSVDLSKYATVGVSSSHAIGYNAADTLPAYEDHMSKEEKKKLKVQAIDHWGRPTFTHSNRVSVFDGGSYAVRYRRYDSEKYEWITIIPEFRVKSKFQVNILYDWIMRIAQQHFKNRFYIVRNDHDFQDAAYAAAEHFERFTRMLGTEAKVDFMMAIDSNGRKVIVIDEGRTMNKPNNFSQIQTARDFIISNQ